MLTDSASKHVDVGSLLIIHGLERNSISLPGVLMIPFPANSDDFESSWGQEDSKQWQSRGFPDFANSVNLAKFYLSLGKFEILIPQNPVAQAIEDG